MNRTKNRINFKIKTGYKLELLSLGTIKLLGSTKQVIDKGQKTVNIPKLELIKTVLMHWNAAKNDYHQASQVVFAFASIKKFGQLIVAINAVT